jgi:hypothetical protein
LYREVAQHFPQAGKGRRHPDGHPAGFDDTLLAEVHALMVRLLPDQP